MRKPTIYEIRKNVSGWSHYFDKETLDHFGQRLTDFTVVKSPTNRIFVYARTSWVHIELPDEPRIPVNYSFAEWNQYQSRMFPISESNKTLKNVLDYIKRH